jgi:hypothetical protein
MNIPEILPVRPDNASAALVVYYSIATGKTLKSYQLDSVNIHHDLADLLSSVLHKQHNCKSVYSGDPKVPKARTEPHMRSKFYGQLSNVGVERDIS